MHTIFKTCFLTIIALVLTQDLHGQKWSLAKEADVSHRAAERQIIPEKYDLYSVDIDNMRKTLLEVEVGISRSDASIIIELPIPGGSIEAFKMVRRDVFHPNLAARYPKIQAYTGYNVEDPRQTVKLSMSHKGMDAMITGDGANSVFIDRYAKGDDTHYISYHKKDLSRAGKGFECSVEHTPKDYKDLSDELRYGDCTLRTYRLALACTGEYASFHGGTTEDVLAAYNTAMNRVNGLYETESAITMQLIENTDQLIFFNSATDPYSNNNGGAMLGQNQSTVDQIVGSNNYDIGHVFSTGGGGIAAIRSPCTNRKAEGVTGLPSPVNDPFYVDYVAHEIGHQFGANHTYNNACAGSNGVPNRNNSTAVEPGSGATIMAYAGICAPNVQNNSDDYFHTVSLREMANFVVAGAGSTCGEETDIANTPPSITSLTEETVIPRGTPFVLTAAVDDPDSEQVITYCWEQVDIEIATMPPASTSSDGPAFRSYDPTTSPSRYFPRLSDILNNTNGNTWERLGTNTRTYDFTLTARDNAIGGGCTDSDDVTITVDGTSGPFVVNQPTASSIWNSGSTEVVEWDVAGTDTAPVSCETVDIWLSATDERNFDILLAEGVPNDGSHEITVPSINTFDARVMVRCATSIFLDISNGDFAIVAPYEVTTTTDRQTACPSDEVIYEFQYQATGDFDGVVDFTIEGLPASIVSTLSQGAVSMDTDFQLTLSNLQSVEPGRYPFVLRGSNPTANSISNLELYIAAPTNVLLSNISPTDGSRGQGLAVTLEWDDVPGDVGYQVQASESPDFSNLLADETVGTPTFDLAGLDPSTVYYWRAAVLSPCFELEYLSVQAFQTFGLQCETTETNEAVVITESDDNDLDSEIEVTFPDNIALTTVSLIVEHSYVGDLTANITSPMGTNVSLFDRPGVPESNFGCARDNMNVTFADAAIRSYDEFESTCDADPNFTISGTFVPDGSLGAFVDEPAAGVWTLNLTDSFDPDGGQLLSWSIETCSELPLEEALLLRNEGKTLQDEAVAIINTDDIEITTSDNTITTYTLISNGAVGSLQQFDTSAGGFVSLTAGSTFTQEDLATDQVRYQFEGSDEETDELLFDIVNAENQWIQDVVFNINIDLTVLAASAVITSSLSCNGDSTGVITAAGIGGIPPYQYSIDGSAFMEANTFSQLGSGNYEISIKDAAGTEALTSISLPEPTAIIASADINQNSVVVTASGGTGQLTYSSDGTSFQSQNIFTLENENIYDITIMDEAACTTVLESIEINFLEAIEVETTTPLCNGDETGSITVVNTTGGPEPYTFILDGASQTSPEFLELMAGTYALEVRDANMESISQMVSIAEPLALSVTTDTMQSSATVVVTGGTPPYVSTILGIEGENGTFTDLVNGEYEVEVVDANGCTTTDTFVIENSEVSTQAVAAADINLYPSPATDRLTIVNSSRYTFMTVDIVNIAGAIVATLPYSNVLDIEMLTAGTYIIRLKGADAVATKRIVKVSR